MHLSLRPQVVLLACALAGCGTTEPARFYSLEAPSASGARESSPVSEVPRDLALDVGPVVLSEGLDRPQMLTRLGPHELALHDYSRWAEPLGENIARVLADELSAQLGSPRVGLVPGAETHERGWRVTLHVLHCEGGADGASLLVVRWRLYRPGESAPATTRRSSFTTPLPTPDAAGLAAALSADLAALAREITSALPLASG